MSSKTELYEVPAPVAASLGSGRNLFIKMLAKEIENGSTNIEPKQMSEICRLLGDVLEDNRKMRAMLKSVEELKDDLKNIEYEMKHSFELINERFTNVKQVIDDTLEDLDEL